MGPFKVLLEALLLQRHPHFPFLIAHCVWSRCFPPSHSPCLSPLHKSHTSFPFYIYFAILFAFFFLTLSLPYSLCAILTPFSCNPTTPPTTLSSHFVISDMPFWQSPLCERCSSTISLHRAWRNMTLTHLLLQSVSFHASNRKKKIVANSVFFFFSFSPLRHSVHHKTFSFGTTSPVRCSFVWLFFLNVQLANP